MTDPKIVVVEDNMLKLFERIKENIEDRTNELALEGAVNLEQEVESGVAGGSGSVAVWRQQGSEWLTGSSPKSVYFVMNNGDSSYEEAASEFMSTVKRAYAPEDELLFPEWKPEPEPGKVKASFGSCSLIMAFWEYGHTNLFTGQEESVPIISYVAFEMWGKMKTHYKNIMQSNG